MPLNAPPRPQLPRLPGDDTLGQPLYYNEYPVRASTPPIMRIALSAGLLSGALCMTTFTALAAEGSSLRGLKPLSGAFEAEPLAAMFTGTAPGLKGDTDRRMFELSPRLSNFGGTFETRQSSANDIDFALGLHRPTGQNIAALAERNIHTLHDAVPRYTLFTHAEQALPGGWGLGFGVRHREYNFATSSLVALSASGNWGSWRSGYTLFSDSSGGSTRRMRVSYSYGERNTIGLAYTTGRDIETPSVPLGLQLQDVRDWTLSGRHWLSPSWALTYDVLSQEQNGHYRRQGLRFGVRGSF